MSFQEKSTWIVLVVTVLVYSWYFTTIWAELNSVPVIDISYQATMLTTVGLLVALMVIGFILVAIISRGDDDGSDERDWAINRYGEYIGGYVLSVGALTTLALAMTETEHFWIANCILLTLVLSEVVSGVTKALLYRRGTFSW